MSLELQERNRTTPRPVVSKWSNRFIWAAIIQGLAATLITIPIVLPWIKPAVSQVMAAGSAGTWFTVGYLSYITVGVIAVAVTALFYQHFEVNLGEPYTGTLSNYLAWIHLILMNVGVATTAALLMYGGYFGGAALLPVAQGGLGETTEWVHVNILSQLVNPIGYSIIIAGIGVLAGGLGFLINHLKW